MYRTNGEVQAPPGFTQAQRARRGSVTFIPRSEEKEKKQEAEAEQASQGCSKSSALSHFGDMLMRLVRAIRVKGMACEPKEEAAGGGEK